MPTLDERVSRHDREIAEIRRLLLMSAAEHVKSRREMRESRETHAKEMRAIREEHAKEMREIREMIKGFARRGNGHEKRRIE